MHSSKAELKEPDLYAIANGLLDYQDSQATVSMIREKSQQIFRTGRAFFHAELHTYPRMLLGVL
jgi:redox-sensitive bicupin YhaK (pirin superfamily)